MAKVGKRGRKTPPRLRRKALSPRPAPAAPRRSDREYLELAMRALNESVYDWDIAHNRFTPSRSMTRILGLPAKRLALKAWQKAIHPEDYPGFRSATVEHLKGRSKRFEYDYRYRDRNGKWRWARTHGVAIRDKQGRAVRMVGSTGDITEIKRVEQALKDSQERYALATQAATEGIYEWNLESGALFLSDRSKTFFAIKGDTLSPATWNKRVHEEDYPGYRQAIVSYFKGRKKTFEHEYRIRNASGGYSWVVDRGVAVRNAEGRVTRLVGALTDVTQRKLHELELQRARDEATAALERQTATAEILRVMARSPSEVQPVFDAIARGATRLCDASFCVVFRYDGKVITVAADDGRVPGTLAAVRAAYPTPPGKQSISARAILERRVISIADAQNMPDASQAGRAKVIGYRSILAVPMIKGDAALGTINVARFEVKPFTDAQIELLKTFADQAVIAIENVRLFNETKEALERQTATAEILKVIASSPSDVQPVLDAVAASAARLCGAADAIIRRVEGEFLPVVAQFGSLGSVPSPPLSRASAAGRAILERETVHIADTAAEPQAEYGDGRTMASAGGYRSVLATPLLPAGDGPALGVIVIRRVELQPFTAKQVDLLATFASQAVIAIENVRLFNETKEALERQTVTAEILNVIASSPSDVQPVFDAIVKNCHNLFEGSRVVLWLIGEGRIHARAGTGELSEPIPIDRGSAIGVCAIEGRMIHLPDLEKAAEQYPRMRQLGLKFGYRSGIYAPLLRAGGAIGGISVLRREAGAFDDKAVALLKTFADQAVIAIENVRLFNETREALERQTATAEILNVIASSPSDVQPVFDAIAASARRLLDANAALVARRAGDQLELAAYTSTGEVADAALRKLFPAPITGQGHLGKAILSGQPVGISDILNDERYSEAFRASVRARGLRSLVSVPMMREGEAIGVISVNRTVPGNFSEHQTNLLKTFADQAVIAIENVRLFNETKEALERQTATSEVLKVISESPSEISPVFRAILEKATRLSGSQLAVLWMYEGESAFRAVENHGVNPEYVKWVTGAIQHFGAPFFRREGPWRAAQILDVRDTEPYRRGEPVWVNSVEMAGVTTLLLVPMVRESQLIGTISIYRREAQPFTEKQIDLVQSFAAQAVIAIENVRLFNETKEALERQTATGEILKVIASSPSDVQPVFDAIVASAASLFGRRAIVRTLTEDGQLLLRAHRSVSAGDDVGAVPSLPLDRDSTAGRAILERKALQVADLKSPDAPPFALARADKLGYRSIAAAPLISEDKAIGVIAVTATEPGALSDEQLDLLQSFADQAAIAIQNVRLFNETKEALERQTATAEILRVIGGSMTDTQPAFDAIVKNCGNLFEDSRVALWLIADDRLHPRAANGEFSTDPMPIDRDSAIGVCVLDGHMIHLPDLEAAAEVYPRIRQLGLKFGYHSGIYTPLMHAGRAVGGISVLRRNRGAFNDKEMEVLSTFADQAVIAIENVRLFNETKEALERQTATAEILKVIASSPSDVQPVFDAIAASAVRLFGARSGVVTRLVGDMIHLVAFTATGEAGNETLKNLFPHPLSSPTSLHCKVVHSGKPGYVIDHESDPEVSPERKATARARGYRSQLVVPMLREGVSIGTISVTRREPGTFTDHQINLLQTFADQAVIAIENVRLFNETKEALERQTATAEILKVIASSPSDVQPVFDAIAQAAKRLVSAFSVAVLRLVDGTFHLAALTSTNPAGDEALRRTFPRAASASGLRSIDAAIRTRMPHGHADYQNDPNVEEDARAAARARGFRGSLAVPMLLGGEAVGIINVTRSEAGLFSDHQIELLKTFADQAVIAIENVRLFNETKEALERQTATAEILKVIASSPADVQPVFDAIVRSCQRLFSGQVVALTLVAEGRIVPRASVGAEDVKSMPPWPLDRDSATGASVLDARTINIADTQLVVDEFPRMKDLSIRLGYRSGLYVPLRREGSVIGTLNIVRKEAGAFTEREVSLAETFADQAVIAIENVRLFNETKEALERQTATAEILNVIASSPSDVQPVFDAIVQSGLKLFPDAAVGVALPDGDKVRAAAIGTTDPEYAKVWMARFPFPLSRDYMHGVALLERKLIDIADAEAEKDGPLGVGIRNFLAGGYRAGTFMPMLRGDEAIGIISVLRTRPGPLGESKIELLRTFAKQAVIAIENVRLFNETKESLERQTATAEILKVIASSPSDVQPVFDAIVQSGLKLFAGAGVFVGIVDNNDLRAEAASGFGMVAGLRVPVTRESVGGLAILDGKVVNIRDTEAPDAPPYARENGRRVNCRSMTQAPMFREGHAIGTIGVLRREPGGLDDKQLALLRTFADQAVIAIENVRLFNETKEALERQTATAEILKVIASSPSDVRPVLDAVASSGARLCDAADATIHLKEGDNLRYAAHFGDIALAMPIGGTRPISRGSITGRAVLEGRQLHIEDGQAAAAEFPDGAEMAQRAGYRTILVAPLMQKGVAIGTIAIRRMEVRPFTETQIGLLNTFADQAVIAIENVRLFNETKEALERQTATAEILKVISSSPTDTQPVFDAIVKSALRLFSGQSVGIVLIDGDRLQLGSVGGSIDLETARKRYPLPLNRDTVAGQAILDRSLVNIADTEAPEMAELLKVLAKELGYRAIAAAPMMRDGTATGAIAVLRENPGALNEKEVALLKTFADQAVIAIENVRLFKELQSRTEALTKSVGQLTALGEVGRAISSTLELETVLQTIVSRAVQLTALDAGAIYEYDERSEQFSLQAAENMDPALVAGVRQAPIRKGDGATGRMAVTLEPIQVPDVEGDSYHGTRKDVLVRAGYRAVLAVPLLREDHLLGGLQVFRKAPGEFAPEVVELLKTFATQSAMAIQNARLFREIAEKGKQLEEASRHKSQFLASMSHELRTPLNAILGFNEMILGQVYGEVPADMQEPLADIQTSGKHLLRLINNVLDLAKIEAGRMELSLQDYSVQDTVASVHSTLRPLAAEKGLEFLANVPNDLPLAYGDGGRIAQCLMNLAGNSLKFTKAGKVEISVQANNGLLVYKVEDTGIGIPPDKIGNLFTEFKQTDATIASEYGGTGLGLSISRKFIEMHGGHIWVESELGKGSAFIFEIPLRVNS